MNYNDISLMYVYACARDDGFKFAVGAAMVSGPVNGSVALFQEREHAIAFVLAIRHQHGVRVDITPSVTGGDGYIQLPNGSFHPLTVTPPAGSAGK